LRKCRPSLLGLLSLPLCSLIVAQPRLGARQVSSPARLNNQLGSRSTARPACLWRWQPDRPNSPGAHNGQLPCPSSGRVDRARAGIHHAGSCRGCQGTGAAERAGRRYSQTTETHGSALRTILFRASQSNIGPILGRCKGQTSWGMAGGAADATQQGQSAPGAEPGPPTEGRASRSNMRPNSGSCKGMAGGVPCG
jgi:hypothetical protein